VTWEMAASKACFDEWIERSDVYAVTRREAPWGDAGVGNQTRSEETWVPWVKCG